MKQAIIIRRDLKLPKGKMAVQAAHSVVEAVQRSDKKSVSEWRKLGACKIAVYADNLEHLYKLEQQAKQAGLVTAIITDAGKTVIAPGTVTCCAIGPDKEEKVDQIIAKLKLV